MKNEKAFPNSFSRRAVSPRAHRIAVRGSQASSFSILSSRTASLLDRPVVFLSAFRLLSRKIKSEKLLGASIARFQAARL
jgi:hypothetical protein